MKYLSKIGRIGKSNHLGNRCDAVFSLDQKGQTFLNAVFQQIFKYRLIHMTLEKTAAFTAADVDLCGEILERQMLHIMAVDVVEQNAEPLNITRCRRVLGFTGKRCVADRKSVV